MQKLAVLILSTIASVLGLIIKSRSLSYPDPSSLQLLYSKMKNLTEEVKNLTVHMTQFENLSSTALNLIEGNPPSIEVQTAIKVISEGKDTSKVTKATLIKLVEYLFNEFDFKKKNDLKANSSATFATNSNITTLRHNSAFFSKRRHFIYATCAITGRNYRNPLLNYRSTETQTTPTKKQQTRSKKKQLRPELNTKIGIHDTN